MVIVQQFGKKLPRPLRRRPRIPTWGRRWKLDLEASYEQTCSDLRIA